MNHATKEDIQAKPELIHKCWAYLNDNFHKFTIPNQIKIALELVKKDMPTQLEGDLGGGTKVIIVKEKNGTTDRSVNLSEKVLG
jgi:hypothetical protein